MRTTSARLIAALAITHARQEFLCLRQNAGDDTLDPGRGRMNAVALVQSRLSGDAFQEEWIEHDRIFRGDFSIDALETPHIFDAEIWNSPHAGEQNCQAPLAQSAYDRVKRGPGNPRIEAAQHVIGSELDDYPVTSFRHRPIEAGKPAGSR